MQTPKKNAIDYRRLERGSLVALAWWMMLGQLWELERLGWSGYLAVLADERKRQ